MATYWQGGYAARAIGAGSGSPTIGTSLPRLYRENTGSIRQVGRLEAENEHLRAAIEAKQREIEAQQREIEARQKDIEDKERQIKLMRIDHLKKEEPDIHTQYLEPAHASLPPENPVESAELLKSQPQEALFTP